LSRLTGGFAEEKKIDNDNFGSLYHAWFPDGREVVPIKRAKQHAKNWKWRRRHVDSECPFRSELQLLPCVNHHNLVQPLGWFCERILVFEFMPHDALHDHIRTRRRIHLCLLSSHRGRCGSALLWTRHSAWSTYICTWFPRAIIHTDIKAFKSNITEMTGMPILEKGSN
jgi:hypothetical protein